MPPRKPFAEIGSLKVKTVGTGPNRVKVVLFPGHEYGIEHFRPENLIVVPRLVEPLGSRTRIIQSISGARFISKRIKRYRAPRVLTPTSEAKLARYINSLGISGLKAEEPLAVILKPNGNHAVIYRLIKPGKYNPRALELLKRAQSALEKHGIFTSRDLSENRFIDEEGVHVFDLEQWHVDENLRKKLGLKYVDK